MRKAIGFCFSKIVDVNISSSLQECILSANVREKDDLIMIRHGESTFNAACDHYRKTKSIPYIWKELCNHEGFDHKVLFNTKYMDCPLTQNGRLSVLLSVT